MNSDEMKNFFFILGKNWELSLAEISNFLVTDDFNGKIIEHTKNCALVEFNSKKKIEEMQYFQDILGGILKIGKVICEIPKEIMINAFPFKLRNAGLLKDSREIVTKEIREKYLPKLKLKKFEDFFFAISIYPTLFDKPDINLTKSYPFINKFIKKEIEEAYKIKTNYFRYPEKNIKSGQINPIWPHNIHNYSLLDEKAAEIVIIFTKNKCYLGKTISADNPNLNKMIDEKRPKASFSITTPPKISKILINLAVQNNKKEILDCFCGSGTILMMALLRDIPFVGTDINQQMVKKTRNNLDWLSEMLTIKSMITKEKVFQLDAKELSKKFQPNSIEAIVTEPYLGPVFKKNPTKVECEEITRMRLMPLYKEIFKEFEVILKKSGRVVIITPVFLLKDMKEYDLHLDIIINNQKFKYVHLLPKESFSHYSLKDVDKKHLIIRKRKKFVFRKVNVFEKI